MFRVITNSVSARLPARLPPSIARRFDFHSSAQSRPAGLSTRRTRQPNWLPRSSIAIPSPAPPPPPPRSHLRSASWGLSPKQVLLGVMALAILTAAAQKLWQGSSPTAPTTATTPTPPASRRDHVVSQQTTSTPSEPPSYLTYGATLNSGLSRADADKTVRKIDAHIKRGLALDDTVFGIFQRHDYGKTTLFMRVPTNRPNIDQELLQISGVKSISTNAGEPFSYNRLAPLDTATTSSQTWYTDPVKRGPLRNTSKARSDALMFIIDSPVDSSHPEFHLGQVSLLSKDSKDGKGGKDLILAPNPPVLDPESAYHGTFVASLIAGKSCGLLPGQRIISVVPKDLSSHSLSAAIYSIRKFLAQKQNTNKRAVVNLSIGGPHVSELVDALRELGDLQLDGALRGRQVLIVGAAGNQSELDSRPLPCHTIFPGTLNSVLLVGAVDKNLQEAEFSHYGHRIDLFAPGVAVWGANPRLSSSGTPFSSGNGTSFAAPIVCGLALRKLAHLDKELIRQSKPAADMATLKDHMLESARRQSMACGPSGAVRLADRIEGEEKHHISAPFAPGLEFELGDDPWWKTVLRWFGSSD